MRAVQRWLLAFCVAMLVTSGCSPDDPAQRANWLPAPKGDFSLYVRAYWPREPVTNGTWTPPAVVQTR